MDISTATLYLSTDFSTDSGGRYRRARFHQGATGQLVAREQGRGYDGSATDSAVASSAPAAAASGTAGARTGAADDPQIPEAMRGLVDAAAIVCGVGVDDLSEESLGDELAALETVCRRLSARQARLVSALAARRSRRAREAARAAGRGEHVAGERARRELGQEFLD